MQHQYPQSVHWCIISGLEGLLNGYDVNGIYEQNNLSDGWPNLSQQPTTVTSALPCGWSGAQHELTASSVRQNCNAFLPVSYVVTNHQSSDPHSCQSETTTIPVLSSCHSVPLSSPLTSDSSTTAGQRSSQACQLELQPAETSSHHAIKKRRTSAALELGNVHLRDLLSRDDDDDEATVKNSVAHRRSESPQEPQSTSCDDPPDSSTGNVSILKQLLADSDSEEQNEVSACEPETTHSGNESHVLLKVWQQLSSQL